jgi:hypothetical protein
LIAGLTEKAIVSSGATINVPIAFIAAGHSKRKRTTLAFRKAPCR